MACKLTIEDKILRELLTKTFVPKASFVLLGGKRFVYRIIQRLKEHKLVKERSIVEKTPLGQVTIDYLFLTQNGYKYVWKDKHYLLPVWLQNIPFVENAELNSPLKDANVAKRYLCVSATAIMLDAAGVEGSVVNTDPSCRVVKSTQDSIEEQERLDNEMTTQDIIAESPFSREYQGAEDFDTTPLTIAKIVYMSYKLYEKAVNTPNRKDKAISFYDVFDVKSKIYSRAASFGNEKPAIRGGRFTGIVSGPNGMCMMYFMPKTTPFLFWKKLMDKTEINALSSFMNIHGIASYYTQKIAICIAANEDVFRYIYLASSRGLVSDKANKKTKKIPSTIPLGKGFDSFYIVPGNREGIYELRTLLTQDLNAETEGIIKNMLATDEFVKNTNPKQCVGQFQLVSEDGELCAILPHLDARTLYDIEESLIITRDRGFRASIYCREWMIPYITPIVGSDVSVEVIFDPTNPEYNELPLNEREKILWAAEKD